MPERRTVGRMLSGWPRPGDSAAGWLTTALTVAVLSLTAPWGTAHLSLAARLVYFLVCALSWKGGLWCGRRLLDRIAPRSDGVGLVMAMVLIGSIPAWAGTELALVAMGDGSARVLPLYGRSLLLGFVIAFAHRGLFWPVVSAAVPPTAPSPTAVAEPAVPPMPIEATTAATFLARHAPELAGRRLLALEADDHYLRIHVVGATSLVLLRLRDAVDWLGTDAGWQPHRSFWIASDVQARAERRGQAWQLILENGLVVPVSRAALAEMRQAGWGPYRTPARPIAVGSTAE